MSYGSTSTPHTHHDTASAEIDECVGRANPARRRGSGGGNVLKCDTRAVAKQGKHIASRHIGVVRLVLLLYPTYGGKGRRLAGVYTTLPDAQFNCAPALITQQGISRRR